MSDDCCTPRGFCGWSPQRLPADTVAKRRIDRIMPRTGVPVILFFLAVAAMLFVAPHFDRHAELAVDGVASFMAGAWCGVNFWRCRHAHCVVTSVGWLALSLLSFAEAAVGRSLIAGDEQRDGAARAAAMIAELL